jgi:hypothetical protein
MSERQTPPNPYEGPGKVLSAELRREISAKKLWYWWIGAME